MRATLRARTNRYRALSAWLFTLPGLLVQFGPQNPTGVYGYHYRGTQSNRQVDLYFTYNGR